MKTKILLLSLFASVISINAFSQQLKISVNQLDAGLVYTRNQIINALGTPSEIINDPDDVFADAVTYKYGNNSFTTVENKLCFFRLNDSIFSVNGILRTGQHKNTVNQLGGIIVEESTDIPGNYGIINWMPSENYLYGYTYLSVFYRLDSNVIFKIVLQTILL